MNLTEFKDLLEEFKKSVIVAHGALLTKDPTAAMELLEKTETAVVNAARELTLRHLPMRMEQVAMVAASLRADVVLLSSEVGEIAGTAGGESFYRKALEAVAAEEELPGEMPPHLYEQMKTMSREEMASALRKLVRDTKLGISRRITDLIPNSNVDIPDSSPL